MCVVFQGMDFELPLDWLVSSWKKLDESHSSEPLSWAHLSIVGMESGHVVISTRTPTIHMNHVDDQAREVVENAQH